jgi:hypothetical protein
MAYRGCAGVERLFTENARYRRSPYEESEVGLEAIKAFWLADAGETFDVRAAPVAVDGHAAVVRLDLSYHDPVQQEYGTSGCCSSQTTVGSATSRNGSTGRASPTRLARNDRQIRLSVSGSGPSKYCSMTSLKIT